MPEPINPTNPAPVNNPAPAAAVPPANPLEEKIKVLEKQLNEANDKLKQTDEFIQQSAIVMTAISQNNELKEKVKSAVQSIANPGANKDDDNKDNAPATPPSDVRVDGVDLEMRNRIVREVEGQFGYDRLPEADRKTLRQQVEKKLNLWGTSVFRVPVNQLSTMLKDAYAVTDLGKAKEQGRLAGLAESYVNEAAAIPPMSSNSPSATDTKVTADHAKWAKKMDVPMDKVEKHLKEYQETGVMTYKPKEAENNKGAVPSGQPANPPAK